MLVWAQTDARQGSWGKAVAGNGVNTCTKELEQGGHAEEGKACSSLEVRPLPQFERSTRKIRLAKLFRGKLFSPRLPLRVFKFKTQMVDLNNEYTNAEREIDSQDA